MMTSSGLGSATTPNVETMLAVVGAFAATFVAVGLYILFKIADAVTERVVKLVQRRIERARQLRAVPRFGLFLWAGETIGAVSLGASIALPFAFLFLLVAPILLTVGALDLAASLVI